MNDNLFLRGVRFAFASLMIGAGANIPNPAHAAQSPEQLHQDNLGAHIYDRYITAHEKAVADYNRLFAQSPTAAYRFAAGLLAQHKPTPEPFGFDDIKASPQRQDRYIACAVTLAMALDKTENKKVSARVIAANHELLNGLARTAEAVCGREPHFFRSYDATGRVFDGKPQRHLRAT